MFFALWPDPAWAQRLLTAVAAPAGHALPASDLHVTLRFLGLVRHEAVAPLCAAAAAIAVPAFALRFARVEWWREARVLCAVAEPVPDAALVLVRELQDAAAGLGIVADPKPFCPHVTVARDVPREAAALRGEALGLDFAARSFSLAQSRGGGHGGRYRVLQSWPLG
ncbi:MAG: RNA 2',3'-cyclic phosphodiesterase [Steroidobacterales bacterium]